MINHDGGLTLLRPGGITYDALLCVCDKVSISPTIEGVLKENEKPLSPGMKYKHYAPSAPLVLLCGDEDKVIEFLKSEQKDKKCLILCYDEEIDQLSEADLIPIGSHDDVQTQAKKLFSALREADRHTPEIIYAHLPERVGLGLALYNRMIRAAAHTVKEIK